MAAKMADRELLEAILSTLHGLEMCLHEQEGRRNSDDSATASGAGSSLIRHGSVSSTNTCSCGGYKPHNPPSWASQPAMAYMVSLAEVRKPLPFDSASDIATDPHPPCRDLITEVGREGNQEVVVDYSSSMYPSRPLSRLELQSNTHGHSDHRGSGPCPIQCTEPPPAVRYEDTPVDGNFEHLRLDNSTRISSFTARSAESSPNGQRSTSRIPSAGTYFGRPIRRVSTLVRSMHSSTRSKGKGAGVRLSRETSKPVEGQTTGATITQVVEKTAGLCLRPFTKLISSVSRAMLNQQLRMLEISR